MDKNFFIMISVNHVLLFMTIQAFSPYFIHTAERLAQASKVGSAMVCFTVFLAVALRYTTT